MIVGLFASHLAAVPHAHGRVSAAEQRQHDSTPHFHLDWLFGAEHEHGNKHRHGEQGHSAHDHGHSHGQHDSIPPEGSDGQLPSNSSHGSDHDAGAIYLVHAGQVPIPNQVSTELASQFAGTVPDFEYLATMWPILFSLAHWHPPDGVLDASDIYLTLRNLRI